MQQLDASVVVRCYNEADHLGKLLYGLSQQEGVTYEVVLVDSGSTDGSLAIAEEFGVDSITYIPPERFSFGRALNYGCEEAHAPICVLASAHVYPRHRHWLRTLVERFDDGGEIALVYGKQRGNDQTTFSESQILRRWFPSQDIDRQASPFCNNANAAIRRELWEAFPYDEQLTGLEDVDWARRVQAAGYDISYAADAEVVHVHDETAREVFNRYRREAYAHRRIMPEQGFSVWDLLRLTTSNIIADYRAAVAAGQLSSSIIEIPRFRTLQFLGTYRGFNQQGPIPARLYQRFYYPDRDGYPANRPDDDADTPDDEAPAPPAIEYPDGPVVGAPSGESPTRIGPPQS